MVSERLGAQGLDELRGRLGGRKLAIVGQVADLRLMSARQIEAMHFAPEDHASALAAARTCRRVLACLDTERLLIRLTRRVGGVHAGSSSWIYTVGPIGHRLLTSGGSRPRFREPSAQFVDHTLAIAQLVVDMALEARSGTAEILACEPEPRCWRRLRAGRSADWLKPDLFVALGVGELEHRWFVEIDRSTTHRPALLRKLEAYEAYYRSGEEQSKHGVFPKVCWVVPDEERVAVLVDLIDASPNLTSDLFDVVVAEESVKHLFGGQP